MNIPFEIHITINNLQQQSITAFEAYCIASNYKPLFIELARGNHIHQPMVGVVCYASSLAEIKVYSNKIIGDLGSRGYQVSRLKIEIPAMLHAKRLVEDGFSPYFEWHGKVHLKHLEQLLRLCEIHGVHLSRNSLKNESDQRFITLREYGAITRFENRVENLCNDLVTSGYSLLKNEYEYCVYDSNVSLDSNWLNQVV